jgi:hypothetical protein
VNSQESILRSWRRSGANIVASLCTVLPVRHHHSRDSRKLQLSTWVQRRSKKGGLARGGHTESSSLNVEGQAELNFQLEEWNTNSSHSREFRKEKVGGFCHANVPASH